MSATDSDMWFFNASSGGATGQSQSAFLLRDSFGQSSYKTLLSFDTASDVRSHASLALHLQLAADEKLCERENAVGTIIVSARPPASACTHVLSVDGQVIALLEQVSPLPLLPQHNAGIGRGNGGLLVERRHGPWFRLGVHRCVLQQYPLGTAAKRRKRHATLRPVHTQGALHTTDGHRGSSGCERHLRYGDDYHQRAPRRRQQRRREHNLVHCTRCQSQLDHPLQRHHKNATAHPSRADRSSLAVQHCVQRKPRGLLHDTAAD